MRAATTTIRTTILRGATAALLLAGFGTATLLSGGLRAPAASACGIFGCDRPGTPMNVAAESDQSGAITFSWLPTAGEEVCNEFQETENGQPVDLHAGCPYGGSGRDRLTNERQSFTFTGLDYGATYCMQVRARDWNGGDPGSGYVSEQWSAWACADVQYPSFGPVAGPQAPSTPAAPNLHVGTTPRGTQVTVSWSGGKWQGDIYMAFADWYDVQRLINGAWKTIDSHAPDDSATMGYLDTNAGNVSLTNPVTYRVCAGNSAGEVCSAPATTPRLDSVAAINADASAVATAGTITVGSATSSVGVTKFDPNIIVPLH
jgi:hypothetical protein